MANIAKRSDGRWRARYRDAAGREHSRHFTPEGRRAEVARLGDDSGERPARTSTRGGRGSPSASGRRAGWRPRSTSRRRTRVTYEDPAEQARAAGVGRRTASPTSPTRGSQPGWPASSARDCQHRASGRRIGVFVAAARAGGHGRAARAQPRRRRTLPRAVRAEQVYLTHAQVDQLANAAGAHRLDGAVSRLHRRPVRRDGRAARPSPRPAPPTGRHRPVRRRGPRPRGVQHAQEARESFGADPALPRRRAGAHVAGKGPEDFVFSAPRGGVLRAQSFQRTVFERAAASDGTGRHDTARAAAHRGVTGHRSRRERQGRADDAGPQDGDDDARSVRPPIRDQLDEVADAMDAARAAADFLRTNGADVYPLTRQVASDSTGGLSLDDDGSEDAPVGFAGVEQRPNAVVVEVANPNPIRSIRLIRLFSASVVCC